MDREDVTFTSGGDRCAAWLYRPEDAPGAAAGEAACVVMAHGFSLTRHDGLEAYAERFARAGCAVVAFDHRFLGDSGGLPRQRFRKGEQLEDWRNAVAFARGVEGVDPDRIALWGFSFAAGHAVTIAAEDARLAAAIALCPLVDGLPRVLGTPPGLSAKLLPRAIADLAGRHNLVPVTAQPGAFGAMTLPGEADGFARAVPAGSPWRNEISPGIFATIGLHRPVARAARIACPLWVGLGERDVSVPAPPAVRLAEPAPLGEQHRYPYDHFDPFTAEAAERLAGDQVAFLARRGLAREGALGSAAPSA
jgi:pimeloyl-ACP methyl ester carboxylesterase